MTVQWVQPLKSQVEDFVRDIPLSDYEKVEWSPNGTYLVVFKNEGFELYGGNKMELIKLFPHKMVKNVIFSVDEEYAISFNGTTVSTNETENYIVWKIRDEHKLRVFKAN